MRQLKILGLALLATAVVACGDDDDDGDNNPPPSGGFTQPAGTVAVNFIVNDAANQVWKAGEMEWKGEVAWNPTTRIAVENSSWLNPANATTNGAWPLLYDDGPWNQGTPPGHEPIGATAGDHIWGVTVFITPPAAGSPDLVFDYGLRDATNPDPEGGGWIWQGTNGRFSVPAGATAPINAPGITFTARGTKDLRLVLDTNALIANDPPYNTSTVEVKGSAWGWSEITAYDDGTNGDETSGDGRYTFLLSPNVGDSDSPPYPGLLKTGDLPEWVWVLNGVEYRDASDGSAADNGVTASVREGTTGTTWTNVPVQIKVAPGEPSNGNTYITVP